MPWACKICVRSCRSVINERLGYKNSNKKNKCTLVAIMCIFYGGPDIQQAQVIAVSILTQIWPLTAKIRRCKYP